MEPPPEKLSDQCPLDFLRARYDYYKKKKETIAKLEKKGKKKSKEEEELIRELPDINQIVQEYHTIFSYIAKVKNTYSGGKEDDLTYLVQLIFCTSLLDDSTSSESCEYNKWGTEEEIHFGKGLEKEIKKLKEINDYFMVNERDSKSYFQAFEECSIKIDELIESTSEEYVAVKEAIGKIIRSKRFTVAADLEFWSKIRKKGWRGGTLKQWQTSYKSDYFSQSTLALGDVLVETWRLEDVVRCVVRGIVKKFRKLDKNEIFLKKLSFDKIILESNYEVMFTEFERGKDRCSHMMLLHSIIKELIPCENRPLDVKHFLDRLCIYKSGDEDFIYNHPCLWSPMENVQNISFARMLMVTTLQGFKIKSNAYDIPEEKSNWSDLILRYGIYERVFERWIKDVENRTYEYKGELQKLTRIVKGEVTYLDKSSDIRRKIGTVGLLPFMGACYNHSQEHVVSGFSEQQLKQKGKLKVRHRAMVKTENELFTVFPLYSTNFFYANRKETRIMEMITSDY